MNAHDDERIDAALEALARPEPPADHVARVLARTGSAAGDGLQPAGYLKPRWVLPVAATVLVALGATWQVGRLSVAMPGVEVASAPAWGTPQEVDRPVLPPQAYWGMDAFEEWASLRPGVGSRESGVGRSTPGSGLRAAGTGATAGTGHRAAGTGASPGTGRRAPGTGRTAGAGSVAAPQMAWVPVPSGLPPIELEPIAPAPIEIAPVAALEDITVTDITLAPIVVAPVDEQEKP
ncbi:hypothetical protein TBR22_A31510 [Luteitalea sp. TBR-22]|uniref:hypothetical protein n=1 Tax=Luteitalea sp. TBR-22 TaxID=2802971 RepID=UPI001AF2E80B|nr:hypothetical protein [Luteitalea sp. TBR-22]BCS33923.1 hypothetical protein TBR22_A31510 [Luteitalea sp. TBR-22]